MSNHFAKEIHDGSIRVLVGMLPMCNAADPINLVNIVVITVSVVHYIILQAS
jgi:hypothetical protein